MDYPESASYETANLDYNILFETLQICLGKMKPNVFATLFFDCYVRFSLYLRPIKLNNFYENGTSNSYYRGSKPYQVKDW